MFDEVLDWLCSNERLIGFHRFRRHFASEVDERLGEAVVTWLAEEVHATHARPRRTGALDAREPLFYGLRQPSEPDPSFLAHGFVRGPVRLSGKSRSPDTTRPINFAFRLRSGFGVSSRAEVMRFLLTATVRSPLGSRPLFTTAAISDAAGFAKRNVQEALRSLASAYWITQVIRGSENLYTIERERWQAAVWDDGRPLPTYRDWTHALQGYAGLHRWLYSAATQELTPYMRASEARRQVHELMPSFGYAGIPATERQAATGSDYWDVFVDWVEQLLAALEAGLPW